MSIIPRYAIEGRTKLILEPKIIFKIKITLAHRTKIIIPTYIIYFIFQKTFIQIKKPLFKAARRTLAYALAPERFA